MSSTTRASEAPRTDGVQLEQSRLSLRLGYQLVELAMGDDDAKLLAHARSLRASLAREWGVLMAPVHIQDDLGLPPRGYAIRIEGRVVAEGTVVPGCVLAMSDRGNEPPGDEPLVADPVFGIPARWVPPARAAELEQAGCMVMNADVVIATHLSEIVRAHLPKCFGLTELEEMLHRSAESRPAEVSALDEAGLSSAHVLHVARAALRAGYPIAPIGALLDAMLDAALTSDDFATVTARAVEALAPLAPPMRDEE